MQESIEYLKEKGTACPSKRKDGGKVKIKKQDGQAKLGTNAGLVIERLSAVEQGLFLLQSKEMNFPMDVKDESGMTTVNVRVPTDEFLAIFDRAKATHDLMKK